MHKHRGLVILLGFIVSIVSIILVNWYVTVEIRRIKQTIFSAKQAIEQLNMDECIKYLADDYTDKWGFNQKTVYTFGKNLFTQTKSIAITIDNLEVRVDDRDAQANFEVQVKVVFSNELFSSLEINDVFKTGKQKNKMRLRLLKSSDNRWQIRYAGLVEESSV